MNHLYKDADYTTAGHGHCEWLYREINKQQRVKSADSGLTLRSA